MGFGNCVLANDTPENCETLGTAGFTYSGKQGAEGLRPVLQELLCKPELIERYRTIARQHVREKYSWENITDQYIALFEKVLARKKPYSEPTVIRSSTPGND
jgi:glycosyltransferase involved in cell wall biosynthesis